MRNPPNKHVTSSKFRNRGYRYTHEFEWADLPSAYAEYKCHGHNVKRPGTAPSSKCGGASLCGQCQIEKAYLELLNDFRGLQAECASLKVMKSERWDWFFDVHEFHKKFGVYVGQWPEVPPAAVKELRRRLVKEEFAELVKALAADDLAGISSEGIDLVYVVLGTLLSYGIRPRVIWKLVHAANMAKRMSDTGKPSKPDGWTPPNVAGEVARQKRARQKKAVVIE